MIMNNKQKYKLLTYVFLFLSLFVGIIFTKNFYTWLWVNIEQKKSLEYTLESTKNEYSELKSIQEKIKNDGWWEEWEKFLIDFSEDELLQYFYSSNGNFSEIEFTPGTLNDFWFLEWKINLSMTFSSEKNMKDFIDKTLLKSPKYNFYIHDFSYPFGEVWPFEVNIPIKILYK